MQRSIFAVSCSPLASQSGRACSQRLSSIACDLAVSTGQLRPCVAGQLAAGPSCAASRTRQRLRIFAQAASSSSPGLLDRPDVANKPSTRRRKPPVYRVLLHNDDYNRREYVVKVLMKIVQVTVDDAVNIMQEAHSSGVALVTMCAQETAEEYCEGLRRSGLIATLEPAGNGGGAA